MAITCTVKRSFHFFEKLIICNRRKLTCNCLMRRGPRNFAGLGPVTCNALPVTVCDMYSPCSVQAESRTYRTLTSSPSYRSLLRWCWTSIFVTSSYKRNGYDFSYCILPRDAMLAWYLLSSCVRLCLCLSVTSLYCIETTGRIERFLARMLPSAYFTLC